MMMMTGAVDVDGSTTTTGVYGARPTEEVRA